MADWRELHDDQNLRMASKMLEQQGEINRLRAELAWECGKVEGLEEANEHNDASYTALREQTDPLRPLLRDALRAVHAHHEPIPVVDCQAVICRQLADAVRTTAVTP